MKISSRRISLLKAVSWRAFSIIVTGVVSFGVTGSWQIAGAIMTIDSIVKTIFYYYR
jgi:uncharacterized membrane protein